MIDQYFKDRDPSEKEVFGSLLNELKGSIPEHLFRFFPFLSFIMLKPDAYLRGLVPDILKFLADNQVYPVKVSPQQLQADHIDSLYMFVKPKYFESWWIMDKVYRLAPSCPAIVIGKPEGYEHLSARIRDLVGPTTPLLGNESQIRYKFRGAHRIFNLIHGTDDPAAAIREALVFFDLDVIKQSLEKAAALAQEGSAPDWTFPDTEGLTPAQTIDLDYPQAKHNLKSLLQARCTKEVESIRKRLAPGDEGKKAKLTDRIQSLVVRLGDLLEQEKALLVQDHPPKEERRLLINVYYPQLRTCSLANDSLSEAIIEFSRDSSLQRDARSNALSSLVTINQCFKIARAMTTDVELKESPLDTYFSWLALLGIPLDGYDEANIHAAWSVLSTEFVDFELKNPEQSL